MGTSYHEQETLYLSLTLLYIKLFLYFRVFVLYLPWYQDIVDADFGFCKQRVERLCQALIIRCTEYFTGRFL